MEDQIRTKNNIIRTLQREIDELKQNGYINNELENLKIKNKQLKCRNIEQEIKINFWKNKVKIFLIDQEDIEIFYKELDEIIHDKRVNQDNFAPEN